LAIQTEDHPLDYAEFEGTIPEGQYGAGMVRILDKGTYKVKNWRKDKIEFFLKGSKLSGMYALIKLKKTSMKSYKQNEWLLIRMKE
ncbi:MAG: ATP-dependent DNA ligase, partial [Candidatus Bathyarchaeota archaeon]